MIFRINQSAGTPLYIQLMEQVKHAVETGALREGDQLPTIRKVAVDLVMNPNTVVQPAVERLLLLGLTEDELRRVFENELSQAGADARRGKVLLEEKP